MKAERVRAISRRVAWLGAAVAVLAGCGHGGGSYVWVENVPKALLAPDPTYRLGPGDVIGVRVWNQEAISVEKTRVREDGKISLPFLNDVEVAGTEPNELARALEVRLRAFVVKPVVTVVVHERAPLRVSVVGRVERPGIYELDDGAGVVHALAAAGGLTPFAKKDGIYVLRDGAGSPGEPAHARIRFRYDRLRRGEAPAIAFRLRRGDVVVVE